MMRLALTPDEMCAVAAAVIAQSETFDPRFVERMRAIRARILAKKP